MSTAVVGREALKEALRIVVSGHHLYGPSLYEFLHP